MTGLNLEYARDGSPADLNNQLELEQAQSDALISLRANAGRMLTGITATIGLFTTVGVFKGTDTLRALRGSLHVGSWQPTWRSVAAVLFLVALLAICNAAIQAARASMDSITRAPTIRKLHGLRLRASRRAVCQLRWSVASLVVGLVCLLLCLPCIYFGSF